MNKPVFTFPDRELIRYERHGIAIAKTNTVDKVYILGCFIDASNLAAIAPPAYVWVSKAAPTSPDVVFASGRHETPDLVTRRPATLKIDPERTLEGVALRLWSSHPKPDIVYNYELLPVYKE